MRSKIRVEDKWYRPVPWLYEDNCCDGCAFETTGCINSGIDKFLSKCDDGNEFSGMIFIPNTKEALAEYVVMKLEGIQEEDDT